MKIKVSVATKLFGQKQGFRLSAQCCDSLETQDKIKKNNHDDFDQADHA